MDGPRRSHEGSVERLEIEHVYGRDDIRNGWH